MNGLENPQRKLIKNDYSNVAYYVTACLMLVRELSCNEERLPNSPNEKNQWRQAESQFSRRDKNPEDEFRLKLQTANYFSAQYLRVTM